MSLVGAIDELVMKVNDAFCANYEQRAVQATFARCKPPQYSRAIDGLMNQAKHRAIVLALRESSGDVDGAATILGVSRATLYRWFKKYRPRPSSRKEYGA